MSNISYTVAGLTKNKSTIVWWKQDVGAKVYFDTGKNIRCIWISRITKLVNVDPDWVAKQLESQNKSLNKNDIVVDCEMVGGGNLIVKISNTGDVSVLNFWNIVVKDEPIVLDICEYDYEMFEKFHKDKYELIKRK